MDMIQMEFWSLFGFWKQLHKRHIGIQTWCLMWQACSWHIQHEPISHKCDILSAIYLLCQISDGLSNNKDNTVPSCTACDNLHTGSVSRTLSSCRLSWTHDAILPIDHLLKVSWLHMNSILHKLDNANGRWEPFLDQRSICDNLDHISHRTTFYPHPLDHCTLYNSCSPYIASCT